MAAIFIHVSDIHFGQERGGRVVVNDDVKLRLIEDAAAATKGLGDVARGVLVTGDVAYAGKLHQYRDAGDWLDRLAAAVGCQRTDVQVVPGNHDIDRAEISAATRMMLADIVEHGEPRLDAFLETERDREMLYGRFSAYQPFAEAYDCSLDRGGGLAGSRQVTIAPGRTLRFIGLNTALICSADDVEGRLLLGARQRVLPQADGEELVVLAHHPLHWLQDSDDARRYVQSRARVFISGHEHRPAIHVQRISEGCDLMMLAAGAAVPPDANEPYGYTYNIIEFDWNSEDDNLRVTVHPRTWSDETKRFVEDEASLGGNDRQYALGCPNFRRRPAGEKETPSEPVLAEPRRPTTPASGQAAESVEPARQTVPDSFPLLLLRFFRDLSPGQRLAVLVKLGALPDNWSGPLTQALERRAIDLLARDGRLGELDTTISEVERQERGEGTEK